MTLDYVRKQIILEKEQSDQLRKIAINEGISFSELVRNFLNAQLRARIYNEMEVAADALLSDYANDKELTEMTSLDGEEIIDG
ncbi:MAG: hypothetical protein KKC20_25700 [Proteobacteria bacterium]|nr:hypothetical protein [Pseudomonadota bacterium]